MTINHYYLLLVLSILLSIDTNTMLFSIYSRGEPVTKMQCFQQENKLNMFILF